MESSGSIRSNDAAPSGLFLGRDGNEFTLDQRHLFKLNLRSGSFLQQKNLKLHTNWLMMIRLTCFSQTWTNDQFSFSSLKNWKMQQTGWKTRFLVSSFNDGCSCGRSCSDPPPHHHHPDTRCCYLGPGLVCPWSGWDAGQGPDAENRVTRNQMDPFVTKPQNRTSVCWRRR